MGEDMEAPAAGEQTLAAKIMAIQRDPNLTDQEKAKKRQELMCGNWKAQAGADELAEEEDEAEEAAAEAPPMFDDNLKCAMCMELCVRPITAPCQHNFCLACFKRWVAQGKKSCPTCRHSFPAKFASNPRINTALTVAIRMAKQGARKPTAAQQERIRDKDRPDEAFTTDRAVRNGRANAASGRIMVTVPNDHFGPIPPSADPRGTGVRVGEHWKDRLDCRQWGAHFPHVAGIAGQSGVGAQSVVLSGGYEDDKDEGEWFLYTGSGGRDLSGNKRTSKVQSFDQKFENMNKALLLSCQKGMPVRVVRSHKEKRSAYAPTLDQPVRYDGIYRITHCWRRAGAQGMLMCRYLFRRCDNEPAAWSVEDVGDKELSKELPVEAAAEIEEAKGTVYETAKDAWWDWSEEKQEWGWSREPPASQQRGGDPNSPKKIRKKISEEQRALRDMACLVCKGVLREPVSTPCGHHFCKPCLEKKFAGLGEVDSRSAHASSRSLRVRKVVKPCPACKADIADFLGHAQVNRDMAAVIARLQASIAAKTAEAASEVAAEAEGVAETAVAELEAIVEEEVDPVGNGDTGATVAASKLADAAIPEAVSVPAVLEEEAGGVAGVSALEITELAKQFPSIDRSLIEGLIEDQGGDVPEVQATLRRMIKQEAAAAKRAQAEARKASAAAVADETDIEMDAAPTPSKGLKRGASGSRSNAAKRVKAASPS